MNGEQGPLRDPAGTAAKLVPTSVAPPTVPTHFEPELPYSGSDQAAANADSWWWDCARRCVIDKAATGVPFTVYEAADACGIPEPDDHHRWGGLIRSLAREGVIVLDGVTTSKRPGAGGTLVRRWIGAQFAGDR